MSRRVAPFLPALPALAALAALTLAACSSWDTGSDSGDGPEKACRATLEAFARAAARCGRDYAATYDQLLLTHANGDCKNVRTIRDEAALRTQCLPAVQTEPCDDVLAGTADPSCTKQLQRTASFRERAPQDPARE